MDQIYNNELLNNITCGCIVPLPNGSIECIVANKNKLLLAYDLNHKKLIQKLDTKSSITCFNSNNRIFCNGNDIGHLEIRDLRSLKLEHTIYAHDKVTSIEIADNLIATCGSVIDINTRKEKIDSIVKIFDLRMNRLLNPIVFHAGANFIKFLYNNHSTIAIGSNTGYVKIMDAESKGFAITSFQSNQMISCLDIGTTNSFVLADPTGYVTMWSDSLEPCLNLDYYVPETASPFPTINCNTPVDAKVSISSLINPDDYVEDSHKPSKIVGKYRPTPPFPLVDVKLLPDVKFDKNVGVMNKPADYQLYNVYSSKQFAAVQKNSNTFRQNILAEIMKDRIARGANLPSYSIYSPVKIPVNYKPDSFHPEAYNSTSLAGLDNSVPNSYVNAAIQALYYIPYFRQHMMNHLCEKEACMTCELGFLFHMLDKSKGQITIARNLLRNLKQIPEAVTMGLLETVFDTNASGFLSLPQRIQSLLRFFLEHLHKENSSFSSETSFGSPIINSGNLSVIDSIFGAKQEITVQCQNCKNISTRSANLFIFPFMHSKEFLPFEKLLSRSLRAENSVKIWCSSCSTYTLCNEVKSIQNLPNVMLLQTNFQSDAQLAFWRQNSNDLPFIAPSFNVSLTGPSKIPNVTRMSLSDVLNEYDESSSSVSFEDLDNGKSFEMERKAEDYNLSDKVLSSKFDNSQEIKASYYLSAIITHILDPPTEDDDHQPNPEHLTSHCFVPEHHINQAGTPDPRQKVYRVIDGQWYLFNDFSVVRSTVEEAINFSLLFKQPCLLFFTRQDSHKRLLIPPPITPVAQLVWADRSLNNRRPSLIKHRENAFGSIQSLIRGSIVALDAEFVCTEKEETITKDDGKVIMTKPARLLLARVSVIASSDEDGAGDKVIIDDYITQKSEQVVDYLTKYSGIRPQDLDPNYSPHNLVPLKLAYIRLRALVDQGVIFVGHGLKKDFSMINLYVPPSQIIDTVELFHLSGQRFLSLRFLASQLLNSAIQTDNHDSIEDSRTALLLYRKYMKLKEENIVEKTLCDLYRIGLQTNWK